MRATVSNSTGYCLLDARESKGVHTLSSLTMEVVDPIVIGANLGLISDWQVIEAEDKSSLLLQAKEMASVERCVSLVRLALLIENTGVQQTIIQEIELLVEVYGFSKALDLLLIAEFSDRQRLDRCAKVALRNGWGAVGNLMNRLNDLQPLLARLIDIWLCLPIAVFAGLTKSKEEKWIEIVESGSLIKLLEAPGSYEINSIFGNLAFSSSAVSERTALARIGRLIGEAIFPGVSKESVLPVEQFDEEPKINVFRVKYVDRRARLRQSLSEIESISASISKGNDSQAMNYLYQLIERQKSENTVEHAVKSLCNVAKQCADMFRTDFEGICISGAHDLDSTDPWTLIQYGDFKKRIGDYQGAEELVRLAVVYGDESDVPASLRADIASTKGDFGRAIELYKEIPHWRDLPKIRTAIADNLRRQGYFGEASEEYERLESEGVLSHRGRVGRAEIAKREGRLDDAIQLYSDLAVDDSIDAKSHLLYMACYAGLLKQSGQFEEAYAILEDVLEFHPFFMSARVLRSSVAGLMDKEIQGLSELPVANENYGYSAYGEWVTEFTRGLLLLKTKKYAVARKGLMKNYTESLLDVEGKEISRLAAAVSFLASGDVDGAKSLLVSKAANIKNSYVEYLHEILEYHIAVIDEDSNESERLYAHLFEIKTSNIILWPAVEAIRSRKLEEALEIEINAMLQLAA